MISSSFRPSGFHYAQMLGWEEPLLAAVGAVRRQEMKYCGRMNNIRASNMALQFISVPLFAFITFTTVCALHMDM